MGVKIRKGLRIVKRGDTWYREERINRCPVRVSLETSDEKVALQKAVAGVESPARSWAASKSMTPPALSLGKALEEYSAWYQKNRRGAERALFALNPFVESMGEDQDVREVTRERIQKWLDSRIEGRSALTVRGDFARARAFLRWIAARKDVPALYNACRGIDQPKDEELTREAPPVQKVRAVLRKLSESHPWMGDYCRLLAETGARPSEILGLRGCDVRGKLVSIVPWEGRALKSRWSKRTIEVNDAAAEILERRKSAMLDKLRPIFATPTGTVYKERTVYHLLREILAGARGKKVPPDLHVTLYDLRHHFASEHASPGPQHMAIESLGAYLGHSPASIKVLLRWYTDQNALRRGAPASVLGDPREGKVVDMPKAKG
jgi:integrase